MSAAIQPKRTRPFHDLSGKTFGRYTVLRPDQTRARICFICQCVCGTIKSVRSDCLTRGVAASCGCGPNKRTTKHGRSETKEYHVWEAMLARCFNPRCKMFRDYGARGITVCDRWRHSFENFFADMGECPPGLSIDRIDNNAGYFPENCRWATDVEQMRNRRSCNNLTFRGETMPLAAWALRLGMPENTIRSRLKRGWSVERTFLEPIRWNPFKGPRLKIS